MKEEAVTSSFDNPKCLSAVIMIILNSQKSKKNFKKTLDSINYYKNIVNFGYIKCTCGSSNIIRWGFYYRNIKYMLNNFVFHDIICIQRIKCKDCGCTHALLPEGIVPYKIFSIEVILLSILDDSTFIDISLDTINKWKYQFNKFFFSYLSVMFHSNIKSNVIIFFLKNTLHYFKLFFDYNKFILMLMRISKINMSCF